MMIKTKTGIEIPEKTDKVFDADEAVCKLLDIVTKLALEVDRLSDEVAELKVK